MVFILLMIMILLISIFLIMISFMISEKKKNDFEKMSPFECGFNIFNFPRNPFSLRFFLISIIFLIFDIEIILLMPFVLSIMICNSFLWIFMIINFLIILMWGLVHEWFLGSLNWI